MVCSARKPSCRQRRGPSGPQHSLRVPEKHFVNGHRLTPRSPPDYKKPYSEWAASGAPNGSSGNPGVYSTGRGLRGRLHPQRHLRRGLHRLDRHTEVVKVIYDPEKIDYEDLLKVVWESHDPRRNAPG